MKTEIKPLTLVKIQSFSTEEGKVVLKLEVLTPFPIEEYELNEDYYMALGVDEPDPTPEFNQLT